MARKPRKFNPAPLVPTTIDLLIAGLSLPAIFQYLAQTEKGAPKDDTQFHELLEAAKTELRARTDRHADIEDEVHLARLGSLYTKAVSAGQLSVAVSIEKEQHRLAQRRRREMAQRKDETNAADDREAGVIPGTKSIFAQAMGEVRGRTSTG